MLCLNAIYAILWLVISLCATYAILWLVISLCATYSILWLVLCLNLAYSIMWLVLCLNVTYSILRVVLCLQVTSSILWLVLCLHGTYYILWLVLCLHVTCIFSYLQSLSTCYLLYHVTCAFSSDIRCSVTMLQMTYFALIMVYALPLFHYVLYLKVITLYHQLTMLKLWITLFFWLTILWIRLASICLWLTHL